MMIERPKSLTLKKVFEHPAHYEVGHCESILNSHGIATTIRNANISSLSGEIPFTSAYPELWILDDSAYETALALLRGYHEQAKQSATVADWTCAHCGESGPGTFASCWHCGRPKSDTVA